MNKYILHYILLLWISIFFMPGCVEDPEMSTEIRNAKAPSIQLLTGSSQEYPIKKTATTITIQAEVTKANGMPVESYGLCWGTKSKPTIENDDKVVAGEGLGQFTATAKNLKKDKSYYLRPFATNKKGTTYADEIIVSTTTGLGIVQTIQPAPQSIKATSAVCGGKILDAGEGKIEDRGVLLSVKKDDPSPKVYSFKMDVDSFYQEVTDLEPLTTYYVRAFVKNTYGRFVGDEKTFKTKDGKPGFTSFKMTSRDYTSATFSAVLDLSGNLSVTEAGFCFSDVSQNPSIENDQILVCKIEKDSIITGTLDSLKQQTPYYVRAYAKNAFGISYSEGEPLHFVVKSQAPTVTTNEIKNSDLSITGLNIGGIIQDKGESNIIDAGFCWAEKDQPTVQDSTIHCFKGDSLLTGIIPDLKGSKTYYVRAFATNSKATSYGQTRMVKTPDITKSLPAYPGTSVIEASYCVSNKNGYVMGGDLGGKRSAEMFAYNPKSNVWKAKAPATVPSKGAAFLQLNTFSILALGGIDNNDTITSSFYFYSMENNNWKELNKNKPPMPLYNASGIASNSEAYFFGGISDNKVNSQIFKFSGWTEVWSEIGTFPEGQFKSITATFGDTLSLVGLGKNGISVAGDSYSKRLWSTQNFTDWEEMPACPTEAKGIICGAALRNELYVLDTNMNMWAFHVLEKTWSKKNTSFKALVPTDNQNSLFMFSIDSYLYIGSTNGSKKFIKYDPLWDK